MHELCHRCQSELPAPTAGRHQNSDDALLFCPRCSAPQLLLPEHLRIEDPNGGAGATTGTLPPPRVRGSDSREVEWQRALRGAAMVAVVGAVLMVAGLRVNAAAFFGFCWVLSGASIALGIYGRGRPRTWMNARMGARVGVVTGLLMLVAMGIAGSATGVTMRFGRHGLENFDAETAQQTQQAQAWGVRLLQEQHQDQEVQDKYVSFVNSPLMTSPEMKAGTELAQLGVQAVLLLLVSAGGGALTGMLQGRRGAALRGD